MFSRLRAWLSPAPPLAAVTKRCTGATVEETLTRFENVCSEENFQGIEIKQYVERSSGLLVRYEVRWKYSVLDDGPPATHESWALLVPADTAAGDPAGHFRVAKATREHHMVDAFS